MRCIGFILLVVLAPFGIQHLYNMGDNYIGSPEFASIWTSTFVTEFRFMLWFFYYYFQPMTVFFLAASVFFAVGYVLRGWQGEGMWVTPSTLEGLSDRTVPRKNIASSAQQDTTDSPAHQYVPPDKPQVIFEMPFIEYPSAESASQDDVDHYPWGQQLADHSRRARKPLKLPQL